MSDATKAAAAIKAKQRKREQLWSEIEQIAKALIPDYHFLDHKVSTFWDCPDSPIGMCVWNTHEPGDIYPSSHMTCRYCGGPVERK